MHEAKVTSYVQVLARATAQLIQSIKGEAQAQPDSDQQKRLLAAAKVLADATARMIEAAKVSGR